MKAQGINTCPTCGRETPWPYKCEDHPVSPSVPSAEQRQVPFYACEHGVPGNCAFCAATANQSAASASRPSIPDGWALVPAELTAENGMKYHMSGDWSVRVSEEGHEVVIPWDTIKQIHREIVERSRQLRARAEQGAK